MAIDILDFAREVDANRKKLIKHARANNVEVDDNVSLSAITEINTQFGKTESDDFEFEVPEYVEMPDPSREGPFNIVWVDYDGTELFKEIVNKGEAATQFTGEPLLHKQFPDILEWDGWEYNGSLDNVYREVIVIPKYKIKKIIYNETEYDCNYLIVNIDISKQATFDLKFASAYYSYSSWSSQHGYIDWGDGSEIYSQYGTQDTNVSHTYAESGTYIIKIFAPYYRYNTSSIKLYFSSWTDLSKCVTHAFLQTCEYSESMFSSASNLNVLLNNNSYASFYIYYNNKIKVHKDRQGIYNTGYASINTSLEYLIQSPNTTSSFYLNYNIQNLKAVSISENTTYISIHKGYDSTNCINTQSIEYLYIPDNIRTLYIKHCDLKHITVPNNVTSLTLTYNTKLEYVNFIDNNPTNLTFNNDAFVGCTSLKYIKLPNRLSNIGTGTFSSCTNLQYAILPNHMYELKNSTFNNCYKLQYVNTSNITIVGNSCFNACFSLKYCDLSSAQIINNSAFSYSGIKNITLTDTLQSLGNSSFAYCYDLESIYLGKVTQIPVNCFYNCYNLTSVIFPSTLALINDSAFYSCWNLRNIDLSNTQLKSLNSNFNLSWQRLSDIKLPATIESITNCFNYMIVDSHVLQNLEHLTTLTGSFSNTSSNVFVLGNTDMITVSGLYVDANGFKGPINGYVNIPNCDTVVIPEGSAITSSLAAGSAKKIDLSKCTVTSTQSYNYNYNLEELLLPDNYIYSLSLYQTCILDDNLINVISKLGTVGSATLTLNSQQKAQLSDTIIENLNNKGWTISVSSKSYN